MNKWSILVEVDAENMEQFNKNHIDGNLFIKMEYVMGIMKIEEQAHED